MSSMLSQSDVKRLMAQPSPQVRAIVASKLAQEIDSPKLSESEIELAHDIIRKMAVDVEVVVRRALAQSLRRSKRLPHDVALRLANDIEAVALPILTDCEILTDEDLIDILEHSSSVKQKAIAARPNVSEKVCDAVINTTSEIVVATLMGNKTARITDQSLNKAVDRFAKSEVVKESMVKRDKLPVVVAERLVVMVSDRLQEHLIAHHEISPSIAAEVLTQTRERAAVQLSREASQEDTERLVEQMYRNGRLTPTLMIRALCCGNLPFFEYAMASMGGIPVVNARLLIHDPGPDALKLFCERAHMPADFLPLIRIALDVMYQLKLDGEEQDIKRFRAKVIERVLTQSEDLGIENLDYLLDQIK